MASALEGFLKLECDEEMAGGLRAEVEAAQGTGYDHFDFNLFDLEMFYGEGRVTITDATALGYSDADLSFSDFLAAIPDVPPGPRMPGRPRRAIPMPPSSASSPASFAPLVEFGVPFGTLAHADLTVLDPGRGGLRLEP